MTVYEIIYDWCDDYDEATNLHENFAGTWEELRAHIKDMRKTGCYNIEAYALHEEEADIECADNGEKGTIKWEREI